MSLRSRLARLFGRGEASTAASARPAPDRVVFGLGNPGPEYEATRHNVGFRVVECLAERHGGEWHSAADLDARVATIEAGGETWLLVEPQTFMNNSGRAAAAVAARWPSLDFASDAIVIFDDLDLPLGRIRLRGEGGGGGQRGMTDVLEALDTRAVPRLRFGIGRPEGAGQAVIDWVLAPFEGDDAARAEAVVEQASDAVEAVFAEGLPAAMGRFNAKR